MCDVMGHGVRAALVAAIVRSVVSELRLLWTKPGELLVAINRALMGPFGIAILRSLLRHFTPIFPKISCAMPTRVTRTRYISRA
jgi:hypothetical protein